MAIARGPDTMPSIRPSSRGISRTELTIAACVLTLLGAAVTFIARPSAASETDRLDAQAAPFLTAASEWLSANPGSCPTLGLLVSQGYLDSSVPREDPWGGAMRLRCAGGKLFVHSDGKDGIAATADDRSIEVP